MFAKITLVACFVGLVHSGGLQNPALNSAGYGALGTYGGYNTGYRNPAGYGGSPGAYGANPAAAISHVSVVKEISSRGAGNNAGLGYNGAAGWPYPSAGYNSAAGLPYAGGSAQPYSGSSLNYGGLGYAGNAYGGVGYPYAGAANHGCGVAGHNYAGAGYPYAGGANYAGAYPGAAGYGGVATSYSNIYNNPLQRNLANTPYGASPLSYGGYGKQGW